MLAIDSHLREKLDIILKLVYTTANRSNLTFAFLYWFSSTEPVKLTKSSDAYWALMNDINGNLVTAARLNNNQTWLKVCIPIEDSSKDQMYFLFIYNQHLLEQVQIQHTSTYTSSKIWLARVHGDTPDLDLVLETVVEGDCYMYGRKQLNLLYCKYNNNHYSM